VHTLRSTEGPSRRLGPVPDGAERAPGAPATADELRAPFERSTGFTVGVEEDLMLLDRTTGELTPVVDLALARASGDTRFAAEGQQQSQVELATPVAGNAQAVGIALAQARLDLDRHLGTSATIAAAGTHPWADGRSELARGRGSRARPVGQTPPPPHCSGAPLALHVHVAVAGADRALAVYNAARSYLPELAALTGNSPYLAGRDSGCASTRRTLTRDIPLREPVPPAFASWPAFADFVRWGRTGGMFPDATHLPWDLRPHTRLGTLELRVADTQTRVEDTVALVALFQGLVATLSDELDRCGALAVHPTVRIAENARRAALDGVTGWMIDLSTGAREPTRDRLTRLIALVESRASALGNASGLQYARALLADNGAERQRFVAGRASGRHGLRPLVRWLAAETMASAEIVLERRA
jgi:carboxylate-amine ligase